MKLPRRPLTDRDLHKLAAELKIPNFRGVFVRDRLPKKIHKNENGIVNLDTHYGKGTHWVAYNKKGDSIFYFDSYGNLRPPEELSQYFISDGRKKHIFYNHDVYQTYGSFICGHLCLNFLYNQFL